MTDEITDTIPEKIPKLFEAIELGNVYAEYILKSTDIDGKNVVLKLVAEVVQGD